jgi:hypothetical protein
LKSPRRVSALSQRNSVSYLFEKTTRLLWLCRSESSCSRKPTMSPTRCSNDFSNVSLGCVIRSARIFAVWIKQRSSIYLESSESFYGVVGCPCVSELGWPSEAPGVAPASATSGSELTYAGFDAGELATILENSCRSLSTCKRAPVQAPDPVPTISGMRPAS